MYQFFVDPGQIQGTRIRITGKDVNHIKNVLRMKRGEEISVSNGLDGKEYRCGIEELLEDEVICTLRFVKEEGLELPSRVFLFQGLPKADKMELIIQKAVELGAYRIVPVLTSRCISRPDEKSAAKKLERLRKIAAEAAKQSGRGIVPQVGGVLNFKNAVEEMSTAALPIFFFERAEYPLRGCMEKYKGGDIAVMVGSEGGFSDEEAAFAEEKGLFSASLGPRILRCETAPVAALSAIMYAAGEMEIL